MQRHFCVWHVIATALVGGQSKSKEQQNFVSSAANAQSHLLFAGKTGKGRKTAVARVNMWIWLLHNPPCGHACSRHIKGSSGCLRGVRCNQQVSLDFPVPNKRPSRMKQSLVLWSVFTIVLLVSDQLAAGCTKATKSAAKCLYVHVEGRMFRRKSIAN